MQQNIKISKIEKKKSKLQIFDIFRTNVSNVYKMLRHQANIYVTTFVLIVLFEAYCKHNVRLK